MTHLWKVLLENTGDYLVQAENHSRSAVEAARRFRPDVLILDMQMPEMDGGEVAACIRADRQLCHTTIVFMTSLVTQKEVDAGKRIEGCLCLPKPTNRKEMLRVIEQSLAQRPPTPAKKIFEVAAAAGHKRWTDARCTLRVG